MVVAKNAHAATVLGGVGRGGIQVHKRYTALLTGILPYERGIIDAGIARIDEETINRMVDNAGQPAAPVLRCWAMDTGIRWRSFRSTPGGPIRPGAHVVAGLSLAGDDIYGWDFDLIGRHALHCGRIWFPHPVTGERIEVTAPPPGGLPGGHPPGRGAPQGGIGPFYREKGDLVRVLFLGDVVGAYGL